MKRVTQSLPTTPLHNGSPNSAAQDKELLALEQFLSYTPRISRALLLHTTLDQHCVGSPLFQDGESIQTLSEPTPTEKKLVAVERREIDGLRSRFYLRNPAQRQQILRGLLRGFSHRDLRISKMSFGEFLKRQDDRVMNTTYFVPERGKWRAATARETARCEGLSDFGKGAFSGFLYTVPRWSQFAPDPKPELMLGFVPAKSARVFVHYSESERDSDARDGIHILLRPWLLILSREETLRKRGYSSKKIDFQIELTTRERTRRIGEILARALGEARLSKSVLADKVEVPVNILWPRANPRERRFSDKSQFVD